MRSITKPRRASAEQWHITNECISIGNGSNLTPAFLPQTFPAPMIYFPRSLWLHHFFCRTSGSCFVSTIANAAAAPYQRHSLQLLFILSRAVFFIPPSRILFRHLAANNSLRFVEPVSQSGNRRGAAPPPSRRTRINSACDSRGHDCRCAGRHVIF